MALAVFDHPLVLLTKTLKMELEAQRDIKQATNPTKEIGECLQRLLQFCTIFETSLWPPPAGAAPAMMQQLVEYSDALAQLLCWIPEECDKLLNDEAHADLLQNLKAKLSVLARRLCPHVRSIAGFMQQVYYPPT